MIVLLTHPKNLLSISHIKMLARKIFNKKRGPDAVLNSLMRGLQNTHVPFLLNPHKIPTDASIHVLCGVDTLKYGLYLKRKGLVQKLIAGPNIVVSPKSHQSIILDPAIDALILPSKWTSSLYTQHLPEQKKQHVYVWPAGVKIPNEISLKNSLPILFIKHAPIELINSVKKDLKELNISFVEIHYGSFTQDEYFTALLKAPYVIYIQEVESQGLALQEAWARDIPTLVWNKGSYHDNESGTTVYGAVSAPYLTKEAGMFFSSSGDFKSQFRYFIDNLNNFTPRQYCIDNLSDGTSAQIYATIIEKIQHE